MANTTHANLATTGPMLILQPTNPRRFRNQNHQPRINPSTNHNHRSTHNKPILKPIRPEPIKPKTQPNPRTTHNHRRVGKDWRWVVDERKNKENGEEWRPKRWRVKSEVMKCEDWRESDEEAEKWERDMGDGETKWETARGERIN